MTTVAGLQSTVKFGSPGHKNNTLSHFRSTLNGPAVRSSFKIRLLQHSLLKKKSRICLVNNKLLFVLHANTYNRLSLIQNRNIGLCRASCSEQTHSNRESSNDSCTRTHEIRGKESACLLTNYRERERERA